MKLVFHRENDEIDRRSIARLHSLAIVRLLAPWDQLLAHRYPVSRFVWNDLLIAPHQRTFSDAIPSRATFGGFGGAIGTRLVYENLLRADRAEFVETELMILRPREYSSARPLSARGLRRGVLDRAREMEFAAASRMTDTPAVTTSLGNCELA